MRFKIATPEDRKNARKARRAALKKWHKWFAWYPVRMVHDTRELRWFETVCRRGEWDGLNDRWFWKYADAIDAVADTLKSTE